LSTIRGSGQNRGNLGETGPIPNPVSYTVCGRVFASVQGLRTHRRMLGHEPDNSCRSCGADLTRVARKPSDRAHYQYYRLECSRQRDKRYSRKHNRGPKARERGRAYVARLKLATLSHYSPQLRCQCGLSRCWHGGACPISDPRILCIDHVGGGGSRHIRSLTAPFYNWLKRNGLPRGFRVLCRNCNWMKVYANREIVRRD
jgi:hypothetical protein